ncbi:MAG: CRISPR-associated primase-polymerase type A1 [Candidatus Cloacimonetes bacterium]|jgi:tetratricopeptide (TPR) repeat protein|nr:CRISPR-associated primase-polymerase type A1 [Candidatus Cloacimonadota bacterium]
MDKVLESKKQIFNALIDEKKEDEAIKFLDDLVHRYPEKMNYLSTAKSYYQKLGLIDKVIHTLNIMLKNEPHRADLYYEKAVIFLESGQFKDFEKMIDDAIKVDFTRFEYYEKLANYYIQRKQYEEALNLYKKGYELSPDPRFQAAFQDAFNKMKIALEKNVNPEKGLRPNDALPSDQTVLDFINIFSGRENAYARQWFDGSSKAGYVPVKEALSFREMRNHLLGNTTLGVYPLDLNNQVKFMAIDFDVQKFAQYQLLSDSNFSKFVFTGILDIATNLKALLKQAEIKSYIEFSGFKGFHLWIFLKEKMPASTAFLFVNKLKSHINIGKYPVSVETFPKQSKVNPNQLGNLIKIPYGIHQKTGKRSYFLNDRNEPLTDINTINTVELTEPIKIINLLNKWKTLAMPAPDAETKIKDIENIDIAPQILPKIDYQVNLENHAEYNWILSKCVTLRNIVKKIETTYDISNQERLTLMHTFGHLSQGAEIVNLLLNKCVNISPDSYMKSNFQGNPVSCFKIRQRLTTLADKELCNCIFSGILNTYPNPLLHLKEMNNVGRSDLAVDEIRFKRQVENYIDTKKQLKELSKNLDIMEKNLIEYFENTEIDEIETSFGKLKMIKNNDKISFILEI